MPSKCPSDSRTPASPRLSTIGSLTVTVSRLGSPNTLNFKISNFADLNTVSADTKNVDYGIVQRHNSYIIPFRDDFAPPRRRKAVGDNGNIQDQQWVPAFTGTTIRCPLRSFQDSLNHMVSPGSSDFSTSKQAPRASSAPFFPPNMPNGQRSSRSTRCLLAPRACLGSVEWLRSCPGGMFFPILKLETCPLGFFEWVDRVGRPDLLRGLPRGGGSTHLF